MSVTVEQLVAALKEKHVVSEDDEYPMGISVYHMHATTYLLDGYVDLEKVCEALNR